MKILIADDHVMVREGLRLMLARRHPDAVVLEATSYPQALKIAATEPELELIIADLYMPGSDGVDGIKALVKQAPRVPIVVISASESRDDIVQVFQAGAAGYIPKSLGSKVILSALDVVTAGGRYIPDNLIEVLYGAPKEAEPSGETAPKGGLAGLPPDHPLRHLTARQQSVLSHLADGESNKEIGRALDLSEAAIKSHVSKIFRILEVNNRTRAIIRLDELGIRPSHHSLA